MKVEFADSFFASHSASCRLALAGEAIAAATVPATTARRVSVFVMMCVPFSGMCD
jgi:hypothetical protein